MRSVLFFEYYSCEASHALIMLLIIGLALGKGSINQLNLLLLAPIY